MIPDSFRPVAKAIVAVLVPLIGLLVVVGVLDVELAGKITAELLAVAAGLGLVTGAAVHRTRNRRT